MAINWTNITSPERLLAVPNQTTSGGFWTGITFMIWIVLTLIFLGFNFEIALLTSSFIALVTSILLAYAGLVAWWVVLFYSAFVLFLILYIVYSNSRSTYS